MISLRALKNFALALILTLVSLSPLKAGVDLGFAKEDAGQAGAFLDFAATARSLAMGRAHAGVADDAGAVYWNPAGLVQLERRDLVTLYADLVEDTSFGFISYAQPTVDWGTFGLGVVNLRSDNFDRRNIFGQQTGTFDQSETAVLLSHGAPFKKKWSYGSTLKVIRQKIDTFSDTGYGLDLAFMHRTKPNLQFGLVFNNLVAPTLKLKNADDKYPFDIRLGSKWQATKKLLLASDLNKTQDRGLKIHLGSEYQIHHLLALRAGLNESEISAGLGFNIGDWMIDYAFGYNDAVSGEDDLGGTHRFGFRLSFGGKISEEKTSARLQKQGQIYLALLREQMDEGYIEPVMVEEEPVVAPYPLVLISTPTVETSTQTVIDISTPVVVVSTQATVITSTPSVVELSTEPAVLISTQAVVEVSTAPIIIESTQPVVSAPIVESSQTVDATFERMTDKELERVVSGTKYVIRKKGYRNPVDLYLAQGYVYYFQNNYEKSVQALAEALTFDPENKMMARHLDKAKAEMTEEQSRQLIADEIARAKDLYDNGDLRGTVRICNRILSLNPEHIEALTYRDDAQKRINEPINREMKIARMKYDRKDYLGAIGHLLKVKELDPSNQEAADLMVQNMEALKTQATKQFKPKETKKGRVFEITKDTEKSQSLYSQGLMMYSKGQLSDAVKLWKQAVSLDKDNSLAQNAYNRAVMELKEKK